MKEKLYDSIRITAYFLWEYTQNENALGLWCCAEDLACFFQKSNIVTDEDLQSILNLGRYSSTYVTFVRNISYRIFLYTHCKDTMRNWLLTEKLLENYEWKNSVVTAAMVYNNIRCDLNLIKCIRCESIRNYYKDIIQS